MSPVLCGLLGDAIGVPRAFGVIASVVLLVLPLTLGLRPALRARRAFSRPYGRGRGSNRETASKFFVLSGRPDQIRR